jgi:hypothetical protein
VAVSVAKSWAGEKIADFLQQVISITLDYQVFSYSNLNLKKT